MRWQDLKDLFRKAGTVLRADVALTPAQPTLYGSSAGNSAASSPFPLGGHLQAHSQSMAFSPAQQQALFGGIAPQSQVSVPQRSLGWGTVLLASASDAGRAVDLFDGHVWQGRILEVRLAGAAGAGAASGDLSGIGAAMGVNVTGLLNVGTPPTGASIPSVHGSAMGLGSPSAGGNGSGLGASPVPGLGVGSGSLTTNQAVLAQQMTTAAASGDLGVLSALASLANTNLSASSSQIGSVQNMQTSNATSPVHGQNMSINIQSHAQSLAVPAPVNASTVATAAALQALTSPVDPPSSGSAGLPALRLDGSMAGVTSSTSRNLGSRGNSNTGRGGGEDYEYTDAITLLDRHLQDLELQREQLIEEQHSQQQQQQQQRSPLPNGMRRTPRMLDINAGGIHVRAGSSMGERPRSVFVGNVRARSVIQ